MSHNSENEDDPAVYEDSGSDWTEETETVNAKRGNGRRFSRRNKKPRLQPTTSSSDSDEDEDILADKKKKKTRNKKGQGKGPKNNNSGGAPPAPRRRPKTVDSPHYQTGSFVINRKDAQVGDPNKPPCIWRIDGKALLQKFEPVEGDGKRRHKVTSVYTGWSVLDRDLYAPVTVDLIEQNPSKMVVELHWDKLKEITMIDSDE